MDFNMSMIFTCSADTRPSLLAYETSLVSHILCTSRLFSLGVRNNFIIYIAEYIT